MCIDNLQNLVFVGFGDFTALLAVNYINIFYKYQVMIMLNKKI